MRQNRPFSPATDQLPETDDSAANEIVESGGPVGSLFGRLTITGMVERVEATLGLILLCFFTLGVIIGGVVLVLAVIAGARTRISPVQMAFLAVVWPIAIYFEWRSIIFYADQLAEAEEPLGLSMALAQRQYSRAIAPIVTLWWLANAALILLASTYLAHGITSMYSEFGTERLFALGISFAIFWGATFACNCFAMLAVAANWRNRPVLEVLWRTRHVVDLAIALALSIARS